MIDRVVEHGWRSRGHFMRGTARQFPQLSEQNRAISTNSIGRLA